MKVKIICLLLICFIVNNCLAQKENNLFYSEKIIPIYEKNSWDIPETEIDKYVFSNLRKNGIKPALECSDEVFIRRVYLDLIGKLPENQEVISFLNDKNPDKRSSLIDNLLEREDFADYWSMKWCDILRVKSEFPINLWPNAVQAYHKWVLNSLKENKHYDKFVRELLTSSGSNFYTPPVNFYRAIQGRDPYSITSAVALTFMGIRFDKLPQKTKDEMSKFFSKVSYKNTLEWKEEIVYFNPEPSETIECTFPDGKKVKIASGVDPRIVFANWLINSKNPWFCKNIVNRIWAYLLGTGIINEVDDIRPDNPPSNPGLINYLENQLVNSNYDLKHIYRLILNSRTYQQSFIPRTNNPEAKKYFAYYQIKRIDAEVLLDILCNIGGDGVEYISQIPEPYTFIPKYQKNVLLADGSITSPFLEMFGRPSRNTGLFSERENKITEVQIRYLLNSSEIQKKIKSSPYLKRIIRETKGNRKEIIRNIYLFLLSRYPEQSEIDILEKYFQDGKINLNEGVEDIVWAIINSKEFLYNH